MRARLEAGREPATIRWDLIEPSCPACDFRFLTGLHLLHVVDPAEPSVRDWAILPSGALGPPVALLSFEHGAGLVAAGVGPWPRRAWVRDRAFGGGFDGPPELTSTRVMEWNGATWRRVFSVGGGKHSVDDVFLEVVPWGPDGAMAVSFVLESFPMPGQSDFTTACGAGEGTPLGRAEQVPRIFDRDCEFEPVALASSSMRDLFMAGFALHDDAGVLRKRLLEVRRWPAGASAPIDDELDAILGFAPVAIDAWDRRTLLVASSADAYFAVMTPEDPKASPTQQVVVLHFDGRTWSEVLRTPPPWAGIERADDGSVWLVSGDALYVQAPPPEARVFRRVPDGTAKGSDDREHAIAPQQVMPWSATRASVIGRYGDALALFTVAMAEARAP